jgi:hypothetical protein
MRKNTLDEIAALEHSFKDLRFERVTETVASRTFHYYEVPARVGPEGFHDFALHATRDQTDPYVIGVSTAVDPRFRKFWAFHEYVHCVEIGPDEDFACINALDIEVSQVPEQMRGEYLEARVGFFERLVNFAEQSSTDYSQKDLKEFKLSLARVQALSMKYPVPHQEPVPHP